MSCAVRRGSCFWGVQMEVNRNRSGHRRSRAAGKASKQASGSSSSSKTQVTNIRNYWYLCLSAQHCQSQRMTRCFPEPIQCRHQVVRWCWPIKPVFHAGVAVSPCRTQAAQIWLPEEGEQPRAVGIGLQIIVIVPFTYPLYGIRGWPGGGAPQCNRSIN